jgi:hypothetical protein
MIQKWEKDLYKCPLNKRVHFLIDYCGELYECIGTFTTNMYTGGIIRGELLEGNPAVFYKGTFLAWKKYM